MSSQQNILLPEGSIEKTTTTLNLGPTHPATHGVFQNILELEIIPDLEAAIDELFEEIDKTKNATKEQKEDLEELREMRTECFAIVEELKRNELEEEEIDELLAEFMEMKTEE